MRRLTVPASAACAALLISACGGSSRRALRRSRLARGYQMHI
jgi:hypothetical protein